MPDQPSTRGNRGRYQARFLAPGLADADCDGEPAPDRVLGPADVHGQRAAERPRQAVAPSCPGPARCSRGSGGAPVAVGDAADRRLVAGSSSRACAGAPVDAAVGVRDRIAVRIVRREAERPVDARLELLRQRVLEPVGLGVHLVEAQAERLARYCSSSRWWRITSSAARSPARRELDPAVRLVLDEPERGELLIIAVADGGDTPIRSAIAEVVARPPSAGACRSPSGSPAAWSGRLSLPIL